MTTNQKLKTLSDVGHFLWEQRNIEMFLNISAPCTNLKQIITISHVDVFEESISIEYNSGSTLSIDTVAVTEIKHIPVGLIRYNQIIVELNNGLRFTFYYN